ncbi:MAG: SET domain-containing protein [Cytophagales bacterium]|nr:SET domain-containing protein [Cytophagales bacterium]
MLHPHTEIRYISPEMGYGIVATAFIPRGTITWVRDGLDRELSPADLAALPELLREAALTYTYRNRAGNFILCWDHTRYMNHSFSPNTMPTAYGLELAIRDIKAGEQLTNDYGCLNILEPFEPAKESSGRGVVCPDDLLRMAPEWDQQLKAAFTVFLEVEQALLPLLTASAWDELRAIAIGQQPMRSILENLCPV